MIRCRQTRLAEGEEGTREPMSLSAVAFHDAIVLALPGGAWVKPSAQCDSRFCFTKASSRPANRSGDPLRKGAKTNLVCTERGVSFTDLGELILLQFAREPHQCRPESRMYVRDLPVHQPANEHVR